MTALSMKKYFEPHSEERPDLVEQDEEMKMRVEAAKIRERDRRREQMIVVGLLSLVAIGLLGLSVYHNLYEVHHLEALENIFN